MKKIFFNLMIIMAAAAFAAGGTIAYFSDTETASGNAFKAGKLNLAVASECSYNGKECVCDGPFCQWAGTDETCACAWEEKDLSGELFFGLDDIKPGDFGKATIGLRVKDNDAWICAQIAGLKDFDNGCENPELSAETTKYELGNETCGNPGENEGELSEHLYLTLWQDDNCDNILNPEEEIFINNELMAEKIWPLADATTAYGPFLGGEKYCLGAAWNVPLETGNIIQTDSVMADLRFVAIQARHMENFTCADLFTEICDGIDNNFDGQIDEDWPNLGQSCNVGVGACESAGVYVCDANNPAGPAVCSVEPGSPAEEICDGIDNNCNGEIDEDLARPNCALTQGVCSGSQKVCGGSEGWLECEASSYGPHYEQTEVSCDNLDNDCDGLTDEGLRRHYYFDFDQDTWGNAYNQIFACSLPSGYVSRSGDCNDYNAQINPGAVEVCDGVDNDCDGAVDESFSGQGDFCSYSGTFGPVFGTKQCVNGQVVCVSF